MPAKKSTTKQPAVKRAATPVAKKTVVKKAVVKKAPKKAATGIAKLAAPPGWSPPVVVCRNCGTAGADMGRNVACEECQDTMPTGPAHWETDDGAPYPVSWAAYYEKT